MSLSGRMHLALAGFFVGMLCACSSDDGRGSTSSDADIDAAGGADAADAGGTDAADAVADGASGDTRDDASDDGGDDGGATIDASASFTTTPDDLAIAGELWAWDATIEGIPSPELTLSFEPRTEGWIVDATDGGWRVAWDVPLEAPTADLDVTANASRGDSLVATSQFIVRVRHRPVFADAPPATAYVGQPFDWTPTIRDTDGGPIVVERLAGPDWLVLDGDTLSGTPVAAGTVSFELRATDEDGLDSTFAASVDVVAPIDGLRGAPLWMTTAGGTMTLVGCCFDGAIDVLVGGVSATSVERVNAARVEATFGVLPPGEHDVVVLLDGSERGRAPDPLVVVPAAAVVSTDPLVVETPNVTHRSLGVRGWTHDGVVALDVLAAEATEEGLRLTVDGAADPGAIAVTMDGAIGVPAAVIGPGAPVLVDADPVVHASGSTLAVVVGGLDDGLARFAWADGSEATAEVVDGRATVRVPVAASGRMDLVVDEVAAPRIVAPVAADDEFAASPDVAFVHHRLAGAGSVSRVLVRGAGAANPSVSARFDGAAAPVLDGGSGWMLVDVRSVGSAIGSLVVAIGGRESEAGAVAVFDTIETVGAVLEAPPAGVLVDPVVVGVGHGPVVAVGEARVAVTLGGGLAVTGPLEQAFGLDMTAGAWASLGAPTDAPVVDLGASDDALVVLDAAGRLVVWPVDGDASIWTGPAATVVGDDDTPIDRLRLSGASAIAVDDGAVFVAIPSRGQIVAVGLETTRSQGVDVVAGQARVVATFDPADTAWIAVGGPCVSVGTPGRITQWEGLASSSGAFDTGAADAPLHAPVDLEGTRLDAIGVIDDMAFSEQVAWVVVGRALMAANIGDRCPSSSASLRVVDVVSGVGAVTAGAGGTAGTHLALPGYVGELIAIDTLDGLPEADVFSTPTPRAAVRAGAIASAVRAAPGLAVADANHMAADRAYSVAHADALDAVGVDGRVEPVWVATRGTPRIGQADADLLGLDAGSLDADAPRTGINGGVTVLGRGASLAHVIGADGGVFALAWDDDDAASAAAGSAQFLGGRGVDAEGPVAPTEASWGAVRSVAGDASPWTGTTWIVDEAGALWSASVDRAERQAVADASDGMCVDGVPGPLAAVAVAPGAPSVLLLVDEGGAVHLATIDDAQVRTSCATGHGGLGGMPGGFAWGARGRWTSGSGGISAVDRAAGFATAFVVSP